MGLGLCTVVGLRYVFEIQEEKRVANETWCRRQWILGLRAMRRWREGGLVDMDFI